VSRGRGAGATEAENSKGTATIAPAQMIRYSLTLQGQIGTREVARDPGAEVTLFDSSFSADSVVFDAKTVAE
jgi:hypothetical protein